MAGSDAILRAKRKKAQALLQQGRLEAAREVFGQICQRDRRDYEAWVNYGALSGRLGHYADAERAFRQALSLRPDEPAIYFNLAGLAELQQDLGAAEHCYREYLRLKPEAVDGLKRLARLYLTLGRLDEAEHYCRQALARDGSDATLYNCLANVKQDQGDFEAARAAYETALQQGARPAEVYANLGNLFNARGDFEQSLIWYRKSLAEAPQSPATLGSLGHLYFRFGHFKQARDCFDQALQIAPDSHANRWNRALLLLLLGEFRQGWQDYESRFQTVETIQQFGRHATDRPRWQGQAIPDQTLLVYAEQGLGDSIQFCRYLPLIKGRVGRLVFECQPPVLGLMQGLAGVDAVVPAGEAVDHDYQLPLLSLPGILATDFDSIPAAVPYLHADAEHLAKWRDIIAAEGLKVGLVWAGNPRGLNDKRRSLPLSMLAPLAGLQHVTFYSLQKGEAAAQLQQPPAGLEIIDLAPQLEDFADTAAAICQLDVVISVCTAVAHLSGALGRPTWTLLSYPADWRWFLDRDDSPWYPSMRLFRQSEVGAWTPVLERVAAALAAESAAGK